MSVQTEDTVAITFGANYARYLVTDDPEANGRPFAPCRTFEDAITRFTGGEGLAEGQTFRVRGERRELDESILPGDTIVIATEETASGGYKGA